MGCSGHDFLLYLCMIERKELQFLVANCDETEARLFNRTATCVHDGGLNAPANEYKVKRYKNYTYMNTYGLLFFNSFTMRL